MGDGYSSEAVAACMGALICCLVVVPASLLTDHLEERGAGHIGTRGGQLSHVTPLMPFKSHAELVGLLCSRGMRVEDPARAQPTSWSSTSLFPVFERSVDGAG